MVQSVARCGWALLAVTVVAAVGAGVLVRELQPAAGMSGAASIGTAAKCFGL